MTVVNRLRDAMNAHNLDDFLDCFHDDYKSEHPVHPGRGFGGRDQVRANWSKIFTDVPDFAAESVEAATEDIDAAMRKMTGGASQPE